MAAENTVTANLTEEELAGAVEAAEIETVLAVFSYQWFERGFWRRSRPAGTAPVINQ